MDPEVEERERGRGLPEDPDPLEALDLAGRISVRILREARRLVRPGRSMLRVAENLEEMIRERASPAFPVNLSCGKAAAHDTPKPEDPRTFPEEPVKVDLGVEVRGYISDVAMTVDLSEEYGKEVEAVEEALAEAISSVKAGVSVLELGRKVEKTLASRGLRPISNLGGHLIGRYVLHKGVFVPNIGRGKDYLLKEGDVVAIEPFATYGKGWVIEDRSLVEIFSLPQRVIGRTPAARQLARELEPRRGLPFARRWLRQRPFLMRTLKELKAREYPRLNEVSGEMVFQAERTVVVEKDGCKVLGEENL